MATAEDDPNTAAAALPAATMDETDHSSDSSSDESDSGHPSQVEWLATGRARRSTAGNRMKSMLAIEAPADDQDDLELLFAEDGDDAGFTDEDRGNDSDVHMESSSDEEDAQGKDADDDLAGERELERKDKEKRAAARKRKAQEAIPAKFRKKVRISTPAETAAAAPKPPRPKKKSERASWLPSATDAPTRASSRTTTRDQKEQLHKQMVEREKRRVKLIEQMEKKARQAEKDKKPPKTQAERVAEAAIVEKNNSKSLNRWEEAEKQREEERQAKLAALYSRTLEGPVVTFWSGIMELDEEQMKHAGRMVTVEEKSVRKKRMTKAEQALASMQREKEEAAEKMRLEKEARDKRDGKAVEQGDPNSIKEKTADGPGNTEELMIRLRDSPGSTNNPKPSEPPPHPITGANLASQRELQPVHQPTAAPHAASHSPDMSVMPELRPSLAAPTFHDAVFRPISPPRMMAPPSIPPGPPPTLDAAKPTASGVLAPPSPLNMLALPQAPPPSIMGGKMAPPDFSAMGGMSAPKSSFLAPPGEPLHTPSPLAPPAPVMRPPSMSPSPMAPPPPPTLPRLNPIPNNTTLAPAMATSSAPSPAVNPLMGSSSAAHATSVPTARFVPNSLAGKGPNAPSSTGPVVAREAEIQKEPETPLDSRITRSCIIMQNFDGERINNRSIQTQILFGRKMDKLTKPASALCAVTHEVAKYRDPKTGLLFSNVKAYKYLQDAHKGNYKWSNLLDVWVGSGHGAAKGVPPGFFDASQVLPLPVERNDASDEAQTSGEVPEASMSTEEVPNPQSIPV